jgi:hypothetical protein
VAMRTEASSRAVAFSAGGDGGGRSPEHLLIDVDWLIRRALRIAVALPWSLALEG